MLGRPEKACQHQDHREKPVIPQQTFNPWPWDWRSHGICGALMKIVLLKHGEALHLEWTGFLSGQLKGIGPLCFNKGLSAHIRVAQVPWGCDFNARRAVIDLCLTGCILKSTWLRGDSTKRLTHSGLRRSPNFRTGKCCIRPVFKMYASEIFMSAVNLSFPKVTGFRKKIFYVDKRKTVCWLLTLWR